MELTLKDFKSGDKVILLTKKDFWPNWTVGKEYVVEGVCDKFVRLKNDKGALNKLYPKRLKHSIPKEYPIY